MSEYIEIAKWSKNLTGQRFPVGKTTAGGVIWRCRCYWSDYGGRGIRVCDRWIHDFSAFLADMGNRPSPEHSIDRINTNGHYSPENCRWATRAEQARNKRSNRRVTTAGKTMNIADWARETGIDVSTIYWRLKNGWALSRAVSTPKQLRKIEAAE